MEYETLYDIAGEPFRWWRVLPCLIFLIVPAFLFLFYWVASEPGRKKETTQTHRTYLIVALTLLALWTFAVVNVLAMMGARYYPARKARQTGDYETFEGVFAGVRASGGDAESGPAVTGFSVRGADGLHRVFKSPLAGDVDVTDLIIRNGDQIRVTFHEETVLRIERQTK